ncbi:MAG: FHA domain-containing protein [Anaerolineales bacterium]
MDRESQHILRVLEGPSSGEEFVFKNIESTIGRDPGNDFVVDYSAVSKLHAKITRVEENVQVEDLGSSNGTFVNGERISQPYTLNSGDVIGLGQNVRIRYQGPAASETPIKFTHVNQTLVASPKDYAQTAVGEILTGFDPDTPPEVTVGIAGIDSEVYPLTSEKVTFGRSAENDIVIDSPIVSRNHGYFERSPNGGYTLVVLPAAGNPVSVNGKVVTKSTHLIHGSKMRIGGQDPGLMVSMTYTSPAEAALVEEEITFGPKNVIQIGRDADNDLVLNIPQVSRFHAQLEKVGQRYKLTDLGSTNGTFVNGERITGEVWLHQDDSIRIGSQRFVIGLDSIAQYDDSMDLRVEALGLNKWVRPDLNILQNISLVLKPREFVVVVGQSGGGKSTLVDAIAGYRPATHGEVFVNETNVYENFDSIRNIIGFVPQKDIIHMELTVYDALNYSAQLRLPPDTSPDERHASIMEVLDALDIAHRKDNQIKALSGGQQKRVSIGVELLTKPGLFFLDEPSSGLDPGTETALMHLMRQMADMGRTIVLITHATKNVVLADKVIFLARGGHLVWFGPPDESLEYFDQFRSERERRAKPMEFDQIYALLEDESKGSPEEWAERYTNHPAYQQYILDELDGTPPTASADSELNSTAVSNLNRTAPTTVNKQVSAWRQFLVLSKRNLRILTRDRFSLALMLAAAPLVGMLSVVLSLVLGSSPFDFTDGDPTSVVITLFMLTIYGVMVGGLAQMREIVKEADIYKRERLVNLKIFPYVLSKVWVAAVLAIYQATCYTVIQYLAFKMPGGTLEFFLILISLALATMAGMMLGLFASALSPNANAAPLIVILLMLPQIVLGGALVPLPESISNLTSTKWAFQGIMAVTGVGSDIAADACWLLDADTRAAMTEEDKIANGCNCLGTNALREDSCSFPSLGFFYNPKIDQGLPEPPGGEPVRPADVEIPDPPPKPEDESDTVAMADYLSALQAYQTQVEGLQAATKADFAKYESEISVYQAEMVVYQEDLIEYKAAVASAVQPAEAVMNTFVENIGWTFVDKDNPDEFWPFIYRTWGAQVLIISILFGGILILQKRKDVN